MYGCVPNIHPYYEFQHSIKVCKKGQPVCLQVRFFIPWPIVFRSISIRHISNVPQARGWERKIAEGPPCVVLASPGMLQSGTSRELFELWAPDSRNGLIVTGYSVEGTLARVSHPSLWEHLVAWRSFGGAEVSSLCVYMKQWMTFSHRV